VGKIFFDGRHVGGPRATSPNEAKASLQNGGAEGDEKAMNYIVRMGKKGQYVVTVAPPHWAHRDIAGFATEAEAKAWIARHQPTQ
jgi:hypothetical protein